MISRAEDLLELLMKGFLIEEYRVQEANPKKKLDAEIEIGPNIVVQIDWNGPIPEYGLTLEPSRAKRDLSGFEHVGYFKALDALFQAIEKFLPKRNGERIVQGPKPTWRTLVITYAKDREEFTLKDLYDAFERHPRAVENANYRAKLRQIVQNEASLVQIAPGTYASSARGLRLDGAQPPSTPGARAPQAAEGAV